MPKEFEPYTEREKDIAVKAICFAISKTAPEGTPSMVTALFSRIMLDDFLESYKEFKTMTPEEMKLRLEEVAANARDEGDEATVAESDFAMEILDKRPEILDD